MARAVGKSPQPADVEALILACIGAGVPSYAYRLLEEAAADGLRFDDLSARGRAQLLGVVPPEAEEFHTTSATMSSVPQHPSVLHADRLPNLWVRPAQVAETFDCRIDRAGAEVRLAAAWAAVARRDRPVLFRGVGSHWPALSQWSLTTLSKELKRGVVRVAESAAVTFCRESHPDVREGRLRSPSKALMMDVGEFVDRLHVDRRGRTPLLYGEGERVYLQALAPHAMMHQVDFSFLELRHQPLAGQSGADLKSSKDSGPGSPSEEYSQQSDHPPTVLGRLWVSAPGTVSPLHYDMADSYLCQVRGAKRLLLWPPTTSLGVLDPYPSEHALARRLRTDITSSDGMPPATLAESVRAEVDATAIEVILAPGDVVYFPKDWAHHTEALHEATGNPLRELEEGSCSTPTTQQLPCTSEPSFSLGFRTDGQFLL